MSYIDEHIQKQCTAITTESPFELSQSVGVSDFIVINLGTLTLF